MGKRIRESPNVSKIQSYVMVIMSNAKMKPSNISKK